MTHSALPVDPGAPLPAPSSLNFLITGANSGFGLALAEAAARAGHLVHAGLRNPSRAGALAALRDQGLPIEPVTLDVTDPAAVTAAVAVAARQRPIDVLINNAGFEILGPVEELTDAALQAQLDTNLFGPLRMIRAVVPLMRQRRQGRIVNISSAVGHMAVAHRGAYCASKHALEALSKSLWLELRPFGVQIVIIVPGTFPTSFAANYVFADGFNAASPYWGAEMELRDKLGGFIAHHQASNRIDHAASIILRAATEPNSPLHWIVGSDAEALVPAAHSKPFEQFVAEWMGPLGFTHF
jgi:NAD(P)-dependent dehydrogenase (short-subunit alcohol dehydrogenase family)